MISALVFFAVFCGLAVGDDVVDLGDSDFQSTLEGFETALVKFYAPWCGHCKRLAPEFEKAATALLSNDPPVHLVKVDCTEAGKDTCSKYGVSGYPTLKIFKSGALGSDYDGPREAAGIVSFMKKQAGPSSKEMSSAAAIKAFVEADKLDHSIIGFFTSDSTALAKSFKKFADKSDVFRFGHTYDADAANEMGFKDTVVIYRPISMKTKMEESTVTYEAGVDLEAFVRENAMGVAGQRTASNEAYFKMRPLCTVYYAVDYIKNPKGTNYWRNRVLKIGKKYVNKEVHFAIANAEDLRGESDECGLETSGGDPAVCCRDQNGGKFQMKEKFSVQTFESFVNDFLDGKVKQYIKSEPAPASNDGPVKVVVGSTFESIVNDESKDVLIEFYAPWCGHCKSLEPKYNELGEKLATAGNDNIVIAKMDATANDVPGPYNVRGFPTIFFSPKGSKQNPRKYEGGREVKDFLEYLKREASDPVNLGKTEL